MTSKKGFTLIELLVVIAIIGILSGLIIVSMNSANNSAKNARIQSDLDQLRTVAMLYSLGQSPNTYVGYSGAGTSASILIADILTQAPATQPTIPAPTATGYCAVYSIWPTGSTSTYWCVDSAGNSTRLTGTLSNCSGAVTTCR
ncbi:MAG: prepilin-type N-terminal cleavage/methylation domain-containing protein [Candidatus Paceibacterota bacterium]